jgi:hypothetical protein
MTQGIIFKEKQQFRQWWLWLILLVVVANSIWITVREFSSASAFSIENTLIPLLLLLLPLGLFGFVFSIRLDTEIKNDGIYVRFFPVHKKFRFYPWSDIEQIYVRKYSPIGEYGGWGIRGLGKNRALNISGDEGMQLILINGKKLLIGTRKPEEIKAALITAGQSNTIISITKP